ncbi:12065_t:CDS:2, partial [Gigaspora margarita]
RYDAINGKMRSLQYAGFGDTDQSSPLTTDEITSCLKHDYLSIDNNESLIRRYRDVERRKDSGLQLRFRKEKNNQVGDILLYLSKRPSSCQKLIKEFAINRQEGMLCQITEKTEVKIDGRKITNHSARRSAIMILKAADLPEDEIMCFSGHRSHEEIKTYTVDNDLEEFYSYPGNLYTHESESEDNDDVDGTNDDKHVNEIGCEDSQQKSKLYAPFKSPLLKNPPNKKSQKPLYEHQPTNQIINTHQEQNCL